MKRIVIAIVILLAGAFSVHAQNYWPTPGGANAAGSVNMQLNGNGLAVPQSEGQAPAAGSIPVTIGPAVLGSYCMGLPSGTMAAALSAGSPIFSFRYGGSNLAIVRSVWMSAGDTSTAFTAGIYHFDMFAARSFSASDSGGTGATLTGNNGKLRTSFATTGLSDFRVASTGTLTAGTRTLDSTELASLAGSVPATAGSDIVPPHSILYHAEVGEQPLQLANNEGFVIQATVPATGTWTFTVNVCWDEVSAF